MCVVAAASGYRLEVKQYKSCFSGDAYLMKPYYDVVEYLPIV